MSTDLTIDGFVMGHSTVGGDDAMAAGLSGPEVGQALRAAEAAWIDSDFTMGRTELLALLKCPD